MKKIVLAMMLMFSANAGILIEPYIGYNFSGEVGSSDTTGVNYGARLGYSLPVMFSLGLDYNTGTYEAEAPGGSTSDVDVSNLGVFFAVDFPILVRAWATYYVSSELENNEGSGYGLGVGTTILPFISLNLEYRSINYDEGPNGGSIDLDGSETLLSVSLPLDL